METSFYSIFATKSENRPLLFKWRANYKTYYVVARTYNAFPTTCCRGHEWQNDGTWKIIAFFLIFQSILYYLFELDQIKIQKSELNRVNN